MSSGDDDDDHNNSDRCSPPRRRSNTPDTPRKRRRLGSLRLDAAGLRKHECLRRREVEANYTDDYRVLFNEHVTQAASRFDVPQSVQYYTKQVGSVIWTPSDQAVFFAALERLGKDDLPGIAEALPTKSAAEARDFLLLLQDAAANHSDAKVTLRDVPAAIELSDGCTRKLEDAGDALAWYQERLEAGQEQQRYGDYWLITPSIAEQIEDALNGVTPSRPVSAAEDREPSRFRKGVAGACASCKKRKRKCDRKAPCTQCARSGTDCVYPKNPPQMVKSNTAREDVTTRHPGSEPPAANTTGSQILHAIPQARLLQPEVMLTLSRELFMNRSDDIPSPWPHWSHYVSELATEPSIYRTAFNDFHRLVVSVTKRLVQTAIVQATSRMRSQRLRREKGSQPFVKSRDVYTAIDVLGMQRNGSERWRGVPRRCGLRVTASKLTSQGRRTRHVPWTEVESIMDPAGSPKERSGTSTEPDNFKSRATRSGTPLPMHNLTLSDADEEVVEVEMIDDKDGESSEPLTDVEQWPPTQRILQPRDHTGRYATIPLEDAGEEAPLQFTTIEKFDQQASMQEEKALWEILGLEPPTTDDAKDDDVLDPMDVSNEKLVTQSQDWREFLEYRAPWEKYKSPVPISKLLANQKPLGPEPPIHGPHAYSSGSSSGNSSDASSTMQPRRTRRKSIAEVDLRVRSTNSYAALQRQGSQTTSLGRRSTTPEEDVPTQSIEATQSAIELSDSASDMDWS